MLQEETVGITTNPVTQVEVVAVKRASQKDFAFPSAALIGSESNTVPINIVIKKLNKIICVVEEPKNVILFEKIGSYNGLYHVLDIPKYMFFSMFSANYTPYSESIKDCIEL